MWSEVLGGTVEKWVGGDLGAVGGRGEGEGRKGRAPNSGCSSGEGVESVGGVTVESHEPTGRFQFDLCSSLFLFMFATTVSVTAKVKRLTP